MEAAIAEIQRKIGTAVEAEDYELAAELQGQMEELQAQAAAAPTTEESTAPQEPQQESKQLIETAAENLKAAPVSAPASAPSVGKAPATQVKDESQPASGTAAAVSVAAVAVANTQDDEVTPSVAAAVESGASPKPTGDQQPAGTLSPQAVGNTSTSPEPAKVDKLTRTSESEPEPKPEPEPEPETKPLPELEPEPEPEVIFTAEELAEIAEAERIQNEKELNRKAREEARKEELRLEREAEEQRKREILAKQKAEDDKKLRAARRAAKMKKRQELMSRPTADRVIAQYCLQKKGKKMFGRELRVFSMTATQMKTLELTKKHTMESTGTYDFKDPHFFAMPVSDTLDEVSWVIKTKKNKDKVKTYKCEDRASLLTDVQWAIFNAKEQEPKKFGARKYTRNDRFRNTILAVGGGRVMQLDAATGRTILSNYLLKDVKKISLIDEELFPNGFVIQRKHRLHLYGSDNRTELLQTIRDEADALIGHKIPEPANDKRSLEEILEQRHGVGYEDDSHGIIKFVVYKRTSRHPAPITRRLCISGTKLAELDFETNGLVSVCHLATVFAVIRDPGEQQWMTIEFMDGSKLNYMCQKREALIACMLDACSEAGNHSVLARLEDTQPGWTYGPKWQLLEPLFEASYFHYNIQNSKYDDPGTDLAVLSAFSVQNLHDGISSGPSLDALFRSKVMARCVEAEMVNNVIATLQTIQMLLQQTYGFLEFSAAMRRHNGAEQLMQCLNSDDEDMKFQVILLICHASKPRIHRDTSTETAQIDERDLRASVHVEGSEGSKVEEEKLFEAAFRNKVVIMENGEMRVALMRSLSAGLRSSTGHLVVKGAIDVMNLFLLEPNRVSTATQIYDALLFELGRLKGQLFQLFFHPSLSVMKHAGMLMEAITGDSNAGQAAEMQRTAVKEGAFLKHMYLAAYSSIPDQRNLSKRLVAMFTEENEVAIDILRQMYPRGLLHFLTAPVSKKEEETKSAAPRTKEEILRQKKRDTLKQEKKDLLKRELDSAAAVESPGDGSAYSNWPNFWKGMTQDFCRGDLIWNDTTRQELKTVMEAEIEALGLHEQGAVITDPISWNFTNFEVKYPSLDAEPMIGNLYLMRLLEKRSKDEDVEKRLLAEVKRDGHTERFFNWAFERFLLSTDDETKAVCCRVMQIVYQEHHSTLPLFRAIADIVNIIDHTFSRKVRDNLLMFVQALLYEPLNMKSFMNANGIELIVELMSLVHWDDSLKIAAAGLVDNNVMMLEDSSEVVRDFAQYWFYKVPKGQDDAGREVGPVSLTVFDKLWAGGLISGNTEVHTKEDWQWRPLQSHRVLRWRLMMHGISNLSPVEVAEASLDIMLMLCGSFPVRDEYGTTMKPLPRARVLLSDMQKVIPHIVQLLITQQPVLIEKASLLIKLIAQENESLQSKLYRTGIFCFAFMYQGSNVLPLIELVKATHTHQKFQGFQDALMMSEKNIVKKSILTTIFPDSIVLYLHHRSSHDFAKMYLGEHDTPELIWTQSMRDVLMRELAQHTSDFAWQLREFPMSLYDYEPVPAVAFEELKEEVWLHTVYLKNLADTVRFPYWKIDEPVELLRALLTHWKTLLAGDPNAVTDSESYEILGCEPGCDPTTLKKKFRKLAIKYHPDKNPDGHETFMQIQKAYEHLTSKKGMGEGRNVPHGIKLVLRCHVVLYSQHLETLSPYKYSGYPILLDVLRGMNNDKLFEGDSLEQLKSGLMTTLLTCRSTTANSGELCRMDGIPVLETLFGKIVESISSITKADDALFTLATTAVRTFALLMSDPEFLNNGDLYHNKGFRMAAPGQSLLMRDLGSCLKCQQCPVIVRYTVSCIDRMAKKNEMQEEAMVQGVLWTMLPLLFGYDPEGGENLASDYKYKALDTSDVSVNYSTLTELQMRDSIAREAARCIARLAGLLSGDELSSPSCKLVHDTLMALVGAHFVSILKGMTKTEDSGVFLHGMNSNTEVPEVIWNDRLEMELVNFCEHQTEELAEGTHDPTLGVAYVYTATKKEFVVRGIYVRVFVQRNSRDGFVTDVSEPDNFLHRLLQWCDDPATVPKSLAEVCRGQHDNNNMTLALQAIEQMLNANESRVPHIAEHKSTLTMFGLLHAKWSPIIHDLALDIIYLCCTKGDSKTHDDLIGSSESLTPLFCLLHAGNSVTKDKAMNVIQSLCSNAKLLVESVRRGCVLYLLAIAGNPDNDLSPKARAVLTKMSKNPLHGLKVTDAMEQFLPKAVVNGIVNDLGEDEFQFTTECKTPELIWNDGMCLHFRAQVREHTEQLFTRQNSDWTAIPTLSEEFSVQYENLHEEMFIGGIYIRLFLKNPQYNLRRPEKFVEALLAAHEDLARMEGMAKDLGYVCTCMLTILKVRPLMCDHVANLGYIERLLCWEVHKSLDSRVYSHLLLIRCNLVVSTGHGRKAMLKYMQLLANSAITCEKFARNSEAVLLKMLTGAKPSVRGELVDQLEEQDYIDCIFGYLKNRGEPVVNKVAAVEVLKAMQSAVQEYDQAAYESISAKLDEYAEWKEWKDASHELFVPTGEEGLLIDNGADVERLLLSN